MEEVTVQTGLQPCNRRRSGDRRRVGRERDHTKPWFR